MSIHPNGLLRRPEVILKLTWVGGMAIQRLALVPLYDTCVHIYIFQTCIISYKLSRGMFRHEPEAFQLPGGISHIVEYKMREHDMCKEYMCKEP